MGVYVTAIEVKAYRPPQTATVPDWNGWSDEQIDVIIERIEAELECATGTIFRTIAGKEIIMSGHGRTKLFPKEDGMLQRMLSVAKVELVKFDGTVEKELTVGEEYVFDSDKPFFLIWNECNNYSSRTVNYGKGWVNGQRNIKITADVGMAETPKDVKDALIRWIIAETLGPVSAGLTAVTGESGKVQEVWEDYTVTYGRSSTDANRKNKGVGNISGYLPFDRVFSRYINYAGMFSVV